MMDNIDRATARAEDRDERRHGPRCPWCGTPRRADAAEADADAPACPDHQRLDDAVHEGLALALRRVVPAADEPRLFRLAADAIVQAYRHGAR